MHSDGEWATRDCELGAVSDLFARWPQQDVVRRASPDRRT
jgi:hypothetical protein